MKKTISAVLVIAITIAALFFWYQKPSEGSTEVGFVADGPIQAPTGTPGMTVVAGQATPTLDLKTTTVTATQTSTSLAESGDSPTSTALPVTQNSDGFLAGINVLVYGNHPSFQDQTRYLLDTLVPLNITSISLNFPIFQDHYRSCEVRTDEMLTPNMESLRFFVQEAHALGYHVMLRPLMDQTAFEPDEKWRGIIEPDDRRCWFESYFDVIDDYLVMAQEEGIEDFCIGSEFNSMEIHDDQWVDMITRTRSIYSGRVTYASNWDHVGGQSWKQELDYESVDSYYNMDDTIPDDPSVEILNLQWQEYRRDYLLSRGVNLDTLVIAEIGVLPYLGAPSSPWAEVHPGDYNEGVQARYYQSVCESFPDIQGIYWWFTLPFLPDDPSNDSTEWNPLGREAQDTIRSCYDRSD